VTCITARYALRHRAFAQIATAGTAFENTSTMRYEEDFPANCPQLLVNVSTLSEARFHKGVKSGEVLRARSIEPFEGGRWRLRWMRANG
jgi:hypothetical protein